MEIFDSALIKIVLTVFISILLLLGLFYLSDFLRLIPVFKKYFRLIKNYLFLLFLIPALSFLVIDEFFVSLKTINNYEFVKDLCKILFSAGIFTTTLNFLDSLNIFKKNFKSIILSDEFDTLLTNKIDALAYSEAHLNKQSNLENIWQTVTLCKYRQEFPELYEKLKNKIENLLFKKNNISYYYKNFQVSYYVELIDDTYVCTIERTSFTIVRPNRNEFDFDFSSRYNNEDPKARVDVKFFSKNIDEIDFSVIDNDVVVDNNYTTITCSKKLGGYLEYHIESQVSLHQNIEKDRIFTFGSARIIDDLTIFIEHNANINITFVPLNGNKLHHNGTHKENVMSYINRDVLLSGEKFIMFFYRNN